jgi:hypothetical protein
MDGAGRHSFLSRRRDRLPGLRRLHEEAGWKKHLVVVSKDCKETDERIKQSNSGEALRSPDSPFFPGLAFRRGGGRK